MPGGGQGAAEQPPAPQRALSVGFPSDVVIHVTVCTDFASQGSCCVPSRVPENPHTTYALLTQGVYFRVLTAKDPPVVLRSSFEWLDAIELLAAVETRQERPVLSLALATGLCGVALGGWSVGPQSSHPGSSFRHKPSISATLREDTLRPFPSHRMVALSSLLRTWRSSVTAGRLLHIRISFPRAQRRLGGPARRPLSLCSARTAVEVAKFCKKPANRADYPVR